MRRVFFLASAWWLMMIVTPSFATGAPEADSVESETPADEAIVQIFGRMCEYHRQNVEAPLRAFNRV